MTAIQRSQRSKMAFIEGDDPSSCVAACRDDHAQVRESDVKIFIAPFQVRGNAVFVGIHMGDGEATGGNVIDERQSGMAPESPANQVVDLCRDWSGDYKFSRLVSEQRLDGFTQSVSAIRDGNERRRVEDGGQAPKPSSRSSADRSAIESPGPSG